MAQQKPVGKTATKPKLGGEIGTPPFDKKSPVTYLPGRKATNVPKGKFGKTISKAKNGKPIKKANFGALLPLAMKALPMVAGMLGGKKKKMGGTIKKAQEGTMAAKVVGGAMEPSAARIQSTNQKIQSNVNKSAMRNAGDSMKKIVPGTVKNGGSVKKCKYGCK
jgi:hypothetical protein